MLNLRSTDLLRVVTTGATVALDCFASWVDMVDAATTCLPNRTPLVVSTATTTTLVAAPAASTTRNVKQISITNTHASASCSVIVEFFDGTLAISWPDITLDSGDNLSIGDDGKPQVINDQGQVKVLQSFAPAVIGSTNTVILDTDVTNNNAVANTIQDVTGFSFPVTAGETYWFSFNIEYTSAATTTGSRWCISGPALTRLALTTEYTLAATTKTSNSVSAYDTPSASNATSLTAGNFAIGVGLITPSASGTVIVRFASEIAGSAIIAKAGSYLRWARVL